MCDKRPVSSVGAKHPLQADPVQRVIEAFAEALAPVSVSWAMVTTSGSSGCRFGVDILPFARLRMPRF